MDGKVSWAKGALGAMLGISLLLPADSPAEQIPQEVLLERLERLEQRQGDADRHSRQKEDQIGKLESEVAHLRLENEGLSAPKLTLQPNGGGFKVAADKRGDLNISLYTYARYENQTGLDDTYTDSFGRTRELDLRNDVQLTKVIVYFKGWVLDPAFRYLTYVWSANTSQGQGAQVVLAGNLSYRFNEEFNLGAGIGGLPTTRSMEGAWPRFLKVDSRPMADDYFRGSYSSGIWGDGKLGGVLNYRAMVANNLSQLGIDATQMDSTLDTASLAVWCMPTTGEYGPAGGYGDFEHHEKLATRVGFHYTHSTEDRQSQPGKEDPENTQIRISDGTAIFDPGAFAPDTQIEQARYQMACIDAGMKLAGYSLEGEYYVRVVDSLKSDDALPVTDLLDHGFQVQVSCMLIPKTLQLYPAVSKVFGEYGDPWDVTLGVNWFPFKAEKFERAFRINAEAVYLRNSPTGNNTVPYIVGGNGVVYTLSAELTF
jgi:hypothetical protein